MAERSHKENIKPVKSAAELALVKLKPELLKLEEELDQMNATATKAKAAPGRHRVLAHTIAFVGGLVMIGSSFANNFVVGLVGFLILGIGLLFVFDPKIKSLCAYSHAAEDQLRKKELQVEEVNEQIAEQSHTLNSVGHQSPT